MASITARGWHYGEALKFPLGTIIAFNSSQEIHEGIIQRFGEVTSISTLFTSGNVSIKGSLSTENSSSSFSFERRDKTWQSWP